jgi:hypothetical protein
MPRKTTQQSPRHRADGKGGGGTPADRLVRAWLDEDDDAFVPLAEELIARGRDGVLATAIRKLTDRYEAEAVEDFALALTEIAELTEAEVEFDVAELVLLPVVTAAALPDPAPLATGLAASGAFPADAEMVFLAGWRSAEAIGALSPTAIRRVLLDVAHGRPAADLPALAPDAATEGTVAALVGAAIFRAAPPTDDPDVDPELLNIQDEARASERFDAFEEWRAALTPEVTGGALILSLCSPSELADEIRTLLEDSDDLVIEEIVDFVEAARQEAGGEEIVARLAAHDGGVELTILTQAGRVLDARVFGAGEAEGLSVEEVREALEGRVPVLDNEA